ncbi:hypothetical protein [Tropicimonas sp. IMCC6043]|uniref:hypothetical protein n=1 Tax=Tropicimonas sp. IMCC6043 TaxID=2510645 RepID=UPI0026C7A616
MTPSKPSAPGEPRGRRLPDGWDDLALEGDDRTAVPLFLGREIYRRRRIMDAARLLPAFGTALLLLPMLWASDHGTAAGAVYIFSVWLILILAAAVLSRRLSEPLREKSRPDGEAGDEAR